MKFSRLLMLFATAVAMNGQTAQTWDTSGNSLLSGKFYFRHVAYSVGDTSGNLGDAAVLYGNITFDGNGNWSISANGANGGAVFVDAANNSMSANPAATGTYSISASGYGFISSPLVTGDLIVGLVGANGVFVGSATDTASGYNDIMIAAKVASPAPTASSFNGSWTLSTFDPDYSASLSPSYMINTLFTLTTDGISHFNPGTIKGYLGGSSSLYTQTPGSLSYIFSNGAAVATFPNNGTLVYGQKYLYFSADGNFVFGGAPNNFDIIVGVKSASAPALSGLYYQVGLDENGGDLDTYFGSFKALGSSAPQTLLGHQRLNDFGGTLNLAYGANLYDYTYTNSFSLSGSTSSNFSTNFVVGAGGVMITSGIGGSLQFSVSIPAPSPNGTGVYISPQGVVNSASFASFTARIAPGELITLFGSNLAGTTTQIVGGSPAPMSLGNVQVTIGGYPAPVFSVSPGQVSAIVPYEVAVGSIAAIQVNNNGTLSNVVTQYVGNTAPGVFTQCACGIGYGWIDHLGIGNSVAAVGSPVSDSNPAVEGETLAVGLTGLGAVSPSIVDGAVAPTGSTNQTSNTIAVRVGGVNAINAFSGLLPGLAAEYQLNVTLPATGITVGPNYFDVAGYTPAGNLDSYMSYLLTPVQATPPASTAATAPAPQFATPSKPRRAMNAGPATRLPAKRVFGQPNGGSNNQ